MWKVLLGFAAALACVYAQTTTGTVSGFVSDPAGAAVAGANVQLINQGTGLALKAVSGEGGRSACGGVR